MSEAFEGLSTIGSGSYGRDDVHFLLRAMEIEATDVQEKERLIQTQQRHYSEMISHELAPPNFIKTCTSERWRRTLNAWPLMYRRWLKR